MPLSGLLRFGRTRARVADALLVGGLLALLILLPLSTLLAARLPVPPPAKQLLPELRAGLSANALLQTIPVTYDVTMPPGAEARWLLREFRKVIAPVVGRDAARTLAGAAASHTSYQAILLDRHGNDPYPLDDDPYPFRYRLLNQYLYAVLPEKLDPDSIRAVNDAAALMMTVAASDGSMSSGAITFALLDRAREAGSCLPQLNLAALVSMSATPREAIVRGEFERAIDACPDDPTPLWLLGQFDSLRIFRQEGQYLAVVPDDRRIDAVAGTFRQLQERFPGSHAGWSGEADLWMRLGYAVRESQPFTARYRFRLAAELYGRALSLHEDAGLLAGKARALQALSLHSQAVGAQNEALAMEPSNLGMQVRAVDVLEKAARFDEAASRASDALLVGMPVRPTMFISGMPFDEPFPNGLHEEDVIGPVSWGTGRLRPATVYLTFSLESGDAAVVVDRGLIPLYREDEITRSDPWCLAWTWRRDAFLAGRLDEALQDYPFPPGRYSSIFESSKPGQTQFGCGGPMVAAAAHLARHEWDLALSRVRREPLMTLYTDERNPRVSFLYDALQNAMRFAQRYEDASDVAEAWAEAQPDSPLAQDRKGEISFTRGDYQTAAKAFAAAAANASRPIGAAEAQVKQAIALTESGDPVGAVSLLEQVVANLQDRLPRTVEAFRYGEEAQRSLYVYYYALAETGIALLAQSDYGGAAAALQRAERAQETYLSFVEGSAHGLPEDLSLRPEVVENNLAIALTELRDLPTAQSFAESAVSADPHNPLFRQTKALILQRLGNLPEAVDEYRQLLEFDPTIFSAHNDYGVVAAELGRRDEAERAFRNALGVNPDYARAWFNLGVLLDDELVRVPDSQIALAKAAQLDQRFERAERQLEYDNDPYFAGLDLSRPLPPEWRFVETYERGAVTVTGAMLLLALGALVLSLGRDRISQVGTLRASRRFARWFERGRFLPALVGGAATMGVLLWPARSRLLSGEQIAFALGVACLVGAYVRLRGWWANLHGTNVAQSTWVPSLAVAGATAVFGVPWTPLPVVRDQEHAPHLPLIGPAMFILLMVWFLGWAQAVNLPLFRLLGAAALTMCASVLLPLGKYEGALLDKRVLMGLDVLLVGSAVLLVLGYL